MWRRWLARTAGGREVVGSSPATPTNLRTIMIFNIYVIDRSNEKEIPLIRTSDDLQYSLPVYKINIDPSKEVNLKNELYRFLSSRIIIDASNVKLFNNVFFSGHKFDLSVVLLGESELRNKSQFELISFKKIQHLQFEKTSKLLIDDFMTTSSTGVEPTKENIVVEEKTSIYEELIIYTDGGSRGNPGPSASGFVIFNKERELIEEGGEYLGVTTNNQAEYQAVKLALEHALRHKAKKIEFNIDSELVVKQMNGVYKIRNRDLWPVHTRIKELIKHFDEVEFNHVRREKNKEADAKVNQILDSHADKSSNI